MTHRTKLLLLVASLLPFAALVIEHWHLLPPVTAGDYAHYLLHAEALAEGRPYGETGYLYTRFAPFAGPAAQPPGLPLLLTPIVAIGGVHSIGVKWLMIAFAAILLVVAGRELGRRGNVYCAAGAALITGVALEAWYTTTVPGSDIGFAALVWLVITAADEPGPWTYRRVLVVGVAGLLAMGFRLAGVALFPALLLYAIGKRRSTGSKPFLPLVIWGLAAAAGLIIIGGFGSHGAIAAFNPIGILRSLPDTLYRYRLALFASELYPFGSDRANDVYHLIATALLVIGLIAMTHQWARSFLGAFTLFYGAMLIVAEVNEARYMMPLIPVFAYAMLWGAVIVVRWSLSAVSEVTAQRAAFAGAAVVGVMTAASLSRSPDPPSLLGNADVQSLFTTLRQMHARQPMRVAFTNPRVLTLETDIPAMVHFHATPARTVAELREKRITHVIVGDLGDQPPVSERMRATLAAYPEAFVEEYRNPTFVVYRFQSEAVPAPVASEEDRIPSRGDVPVVAAGGSAK